MKYIPLIAVAGLGAAGVATMTMHPSAPATPAPLVVVLQFVDGSSRTCSANVLPPANPFTFDNGTVTISGLACAADEIFRDGFGG